MKIENRKTRGLKLADFTEEQIGFLLLVDRIYRREQELSLDNILSMARIKLPGVAVNFQEIGLSLQDLSLFHTDQGKLTLTQLGAELVQQAGQEHSLVGKFYDNFYRAAENSPAHSKFCQRVYGQDLTQHGMADLEQLSLLMDEIDLGSGQSFVDFGCGSGRITEYLADETGSRAAGIDKSPQAIQLAKERTAAKSDRLAFYYADIHKNRGQLPEGTFDKIIAIDSLFFAPDQELVLQTLWGMLTPGGMMGVFYISSPDQQAQETILGKILDKKDLPYRVKDLSTQNKNHWINKKRILLEMEEEFRQEGSDFLYHNRLAECQGDPDQLKRYLYLIPGKKP